MFHVYEARFSTPRPGRAGKQVSSIIAERAAGMLARRLLFRRLAFVRSVLFELSGYVIIDIALMAIQQDKPLVWLKGEVKTPPFNAVARLEAGLLLRRLQQGDVLGLPQSRPMPSIGR